MRELLRGMAATGPAQRAEVDLGSRTRHHEAVAYSRKQGEARIPARPSIGCIGVAPAERQAITSGPAGAYGGNRDYNRMDEGSIVYLPVFERGAFLMVGDGHAGFGDGELLGQGTETSMDVQFTVNLRKRQRIAWPRVEHADSLVTLGATTGALERGFREAISEMLAWLTGEYDLTQQEAHTLLGLAAELRVALWFSTLICEVPKRYLPPRAERR